MLEVSSATALLDPCLPSNFHPLPSKLGAEMAKAVFQVRTLFVLCLLPPSSSWPPSTSHFHLLHLLQTYLTSPLLIIFSYHPKKQYFPSFLSFISNIFLLSKKRDLIFHWPILKYFTALSDHSSSSMCCLFFIQPLTDGHPRVWRPTNLTSSPAGQRSCRQSRPMRSLHFWRSKTPALIGREIWASGLQLYDR